MDHLILVYLILDYYLISDLSYINDIINSIDFHIHIDVEYISYNIIYIMSEIILRCSR